MKKMKLEVESLVVESFDTGPDAAGERGTVRGHGGNTVQPAQSDRGTCFCQPTGFCIQTDDDFSCAVTLCNDPSCTCPSPTQFDPTCVGQSCGLTYCVDTCDYCASFITSAPERC